MKFNLKSTASCLLLLALAGCQSNLPLVGANRAPLSYQSMAARSARNPMTLIQQYHAPLQQRNPNLVKRKYQAMAESPFAFYRATAFLFYNDLKSETSLTGPKVPLQGDFHLENMGTYLTAQGGFAYDLNDFDEAITGPNSWDLARLAVSVHLAADETGFKFKERQELIAYFLQRYMTHLQDIQRQPGLLNAPLDERYLDEKAGNQVTQARQGFSRAKWLSDMTDGRRFRIDNDKLLAVSAAERQNVAASFTAYASARREGAAFFTLKDVAARVAGKGSLGRYRYVGLFEGRTASAQDDVILELKEAIVPSASYAGVSRSRNEAVRVVQAYQSSLPGADPYLGATAFNAPEGQLPAYIRELLPKETVNLEKVNKTKEYQGFLDSAALIIARMHARSGQTAALLQQTPALIPAIQAFADTYADTVASDWKTFKSSR